MLFNHVFEKGDYPSLWPYGNIPVHPAHKKGPQNIAHNCRKIKVLWLSYWKIETQKYNSWGIKIMNISLGLNCRTTDMFILNFLIDQNPCLHVWCCDILCVHFLTVWSFFFFSSYGRHLGFCTRQIRMWPYCSGMFTNLPPPSLKNSMYLKVFLCTYSTILGHLIMHVLNTYYFCPYFGTKNGYPFWDLTKFGCPPY